MPQPISRPGRMRGSHIDGKCRHKGAIPGGDQEFHYFRRPRSAPSTSMYVLVLIDLTLLFLIRSNERYETPAGHFFVRVAACTSLRFGAESSLFLRSEIRSIPHCYVIFGVGQAKYCYRHAETHRKYLFLMRHFCLDTCAKFDAYSIYTQTGDTSADISK